MITEALSFLAVGIILIVLGLLTWKKQKISILHDYHYKNVKKEDFPDYTRKMGIGQIIIGAGLCISGVISFFTTSPYAMAGLIAGLIIGFVVMHRAQMKYNGSWFS